MTDDEIIKTLECCLSDNPPCYSCKYDADTITVDECMSKLMKDALDLINRQKAEIEALISGQETLQKYRDEEINRLEIELKAMRGAANSYKAEVERLQKENEETQEKLEDLLCEATGGKLSKHSYTAEVMTTQAHEHLLNCCEDERAEAVKEFAERLKVLCRQARFSVTVTQDLTGIQRLLDNIAVVDEDDIDNLVKEMVGEIDV